MDQVPRYFETEPNSMITTWGSREVRLRKGGSSHRRFIATFTLTGDGKVPTPHLLFCKLKNEPTCPPGVMEDVNATVMWSSDILLDHALRVVCGRKETQLYHEPVLYIIDSYDGHVKLADSKRLEAYNVFVLVVPSNMTIMLQPHDVAVNRSYQEYYRDQYDDYLCRALKEPAFQTKAGNPKVLRYSTVAQWTLDWVASKSVESIKRAFALCGLVPKRDFSPDALHRPCPHLLAADVDMETPSDLDGRFDDDYIEGILAGTQEPAELELYAAAHKHNWNIEVSTVDEQNKLVSRFQYSVDNPVQTVYLAPLGTYFEVKVEGFIV
ncbi:hypothetical protein ON010_g9461 [Phytophthora cinnamomi]|nr:hypothetical protein ON010_g9461 [Phytophthora cinnamomi]